MKKMYRYIFLVLVVISSSLLLSGCQTSEEKISQYNQIISEADILIEAKEYTSAVEKLSEASELLPSKVEAIERLVDIFVIKNRLEDATRIVEDSGARLKDSDRSVLYSNIGDANYEIKEYDKASYNYQLAREMGDTNSRASLGIAKVSIQKGNIQDARSALGKRLEGESDIEGKLVLSYIYGLNSPERALEIIKGIEPGSDWRDAYTRWEEALKDLTDDELFNSAKLARTYIQEGYPSLAVALLEPEKEKMSEYIDGIYLLGKAYYEQKEYEKSISLLKEVTAISDLNQYIYWVLARSYYLLDDLEESFSYYDSALSYAGDSAQDLLYTEYIDLLVENNRSEKALEVIKRAERIFDDTWVQLYYMRIYSARKDNDKFEYHMDQVEYESLSNDFKAEYLFSKGSSLIQNTQLDDAKRVLDMFWELDKYDPRYNLLYAQLSFQEGNLEDTRIYCKKAIEYDIFRIVTDEAQKLLAQVD